jgi:hypothetical protein
MEELAERVHGDIRMALNHLQYMSLSQSVVKYDDIKQRLTSSAKDEDISPFTAVDKYCSFFNNSFIAKCHNGVIIFYSPPGSQLFIDYHARLFNSRCDVMLTLYTKCCVFHIKVSVFSVLLLERQISIFT